MEMEGGREMLLFLRPCLLYVRWEMLSLILVDMWSLEVEHPVGGVRNVTGAPTRMIRQKHCHGPHNGMGLILKVWKP